MRLILTILLWLLLSTYGFAKDAQLFNTDVFGRYAESNISLLLKEPSGKIKPIIIQLDIKDSVYYAATVRYETDEISLLDVKDSINKIYGDYQNPENDKETDYFTWRVKDSDLMMQLLTEGKFITVRYISLKYVAGENNKKGYSREKMDDFYNFKPNRE